MHAFEVLGDPVRRRIIDLLSEGERAAGEVATTLGVEFGISQPAVSRHLRVLREAGFASVRPDGTRRVYALESGGFDEAEAALRHWRRFWDRHLDALHTEIARGARSRRDER